MTIAREEEKNILEEGPLHQVMVFFQKADALPVVGIFLLQLLAVVMVGGSWWALDAPLQFALFAAGGTGLASLTDAAFLNWLPKREISFGPWKAQTVVLLTPRTIVSVGLALAGIVLNWPIALGLLFAAQVVGSILLWWAAAIEPGQLSMTYLAAEFSALPAGTKPLKLLHISDIHLERLTNREKRLLALVRKAQPDLIVITGDFLNLSYNTDRLAQEQVADLLRQLEAPYGVYATLGSPPVDLRQEIVPLLDGLPLQLLRDEWLSVELENGTKVVLMGLDCTHHLDRDTARLEEVARAAPNSAPRILLYHSPELMPAAIVNNVDLYLCGHTHGGQVRLPLIGPILTSSQLGRRYVMGHYHEGSTHLYVSRGVGLEGLSAPRVRLMAPPEITLVTLHPGSSRSQP